jgi:hypothetical protein
LPGTFRINCKRICTWGIVDCKKDLTRQVSFSTFRMQPILCENIVLTPFILRFTVPTSSQQAAQALFPSLKLDASGLGYVFFWSIFESIHRGLNLFPTKALAPEGFLLGSEIDYGTSLFNLVTNLNNDSNSLPLKLKLASILL